MERNGERERERGERGGGGERDGEGGERKRDICRKLHG
jgi:hypothetical protein